MAINEDTIVAFGKAAEDLGDKGAKVVDLNGATILPGFGDGHAHPMFAGLEQQFAPVRGATSIDDIARRVKNYADQHPDLLWIQGWGYDPTLVSDGVFHAKWLDNVMPNRPVVLRATDYHTLWVNSMALAKVGINRATPEPKLGEIVRDAHGNPIGTLREWGAVNLMMRHLPPIDTQQRIRALTWASQRLAEVGITWVQDAWIDPEAIDGYLRAVHRGALGVRFNLAFRSDPDRWRDQVQLFAEMRRTIAEIKSPYLTGRTVKFFADGIIEAGTAAMLEPYCDCPNNQGMANWPTEEFKEAVIAFDRAGFQIHIHAIGDGGVRMAVDAIAAATEVNGPSDRRPVIAHAQLIARSDLDRFKRYGIIANFEPLWAQLDPLQTTLTIPRLGPERASRQYPIASLMRRGVPISFGSDWPVSAVAPLSGIRVAVTRQTPDGEPVDGWIPEERISVSDAINAYTTGSGYQAFNGNGEGLAMGKPADFVVLDTHPEQVVPSHIDKIKILETWVNGVRVFQRATTHSAKGDYDG
ncbi:MAG: amidohydrolase [Sulfobacillus benefaciens]|uniref:Amidohydrolase n=1 Tax=Sulfobacillus benefaciens TaxID=453960 RepID=A0A2T2XJ73_9FIRM|nr:MAG: amidohydrolase [Sulfobacillus benefaciens]